MPYIRRKKIVATCTTHGIRISVASKYETAHSRLNESKYVHSYTITIENRSRETVQLLSRHWIIMDSDLNQREVKGDGVIGQQPVLAPGDKHRYSSWSPLSTDIGRMHGIYLMKRDDNSTFEVKVPLFVLCATPRLN